jgi:hypothetical protein
MKSGGISRGNITPEKLIKEYEIPIKDYWLFNFSKNYLLLIFLKYPTFFKMKLINMNMFKEKLLFLKNLKLKMVY